MREDKTTVSLDWLTSYAEEKAYEAGKKDYLLEQAHRRIAELEEQVADLRKEER